MALVDTYYLALGDAPVSADAGFHKLTITMDERVLADRADDLLSDAVYDQCRQRFGGPLADIRLYTADGKPVILGPAPTWTHRRFESRDTGVVASYRGRPLDHEVGHIS